MSAAPQIHWFRRDLRLIDNPALTAAAAAGPVVPVFVLDPETERVGAAARWRLGLGLAALADRLARAGSRLILRRGPAPEVLATIVRETGAAGLHCGSLPSPAWIAADRDVNAALQPLGVSPALHPGHLLHLPAEVATKGGGPFKVFTPFWNAVGPRPVEPPLPAPRLRPPSRWPQGEHLSDWQLDAAMNRGAAVVAQHVRVGEDAALQRLQSFLEERLRTYPENHDRPDRIGTSGLSENLAWGEISPRQVWHAARRHGDRGVEPFLRQLAWRDFSWHLLFHAPDLARRNWRPEWDAFPWRQDNEGAERWRRGMTGEPLVDAGMRALFVTGSIHNRVRLVVASYLCKHLLTDWRVGAAWFEECLIDWDPAVNAMNWQWAAGSGPDAAPFFRIFNPGTQAERFDPDGAYRRRFLDPAEPDAAAFFRAAPRRWRLDSRDPAPEPVVDRARGRARALAAYEAFRRKV